MLLTIWEQHKEKNAIFADRQAVPRRATGDRCGEKHLSHPRILLQRSVHTIDKPHREPATAIVLHRVCRLHTPQPQEPQRKEQRLATQPTTLRSVYETHRGAPQGLPRGVGLRANDEHQPEIPEPGVARTHGVATQAHYRQLHRGATETHALQHHNEPERGGNGVSFPRSVGAHTLLQAALWHHAEALFATGAAGVEPIIKE